MGFSGSSYCKESECNAGNPGCSIPGSGRSPGEGNNYPLQCSCLENPMDRGAWWTTVYGVTKSWTWLSRLTVYNSINKYELFSLDKLKSNIYLNRFQLFKKNLIYYLMIWTLVYIIHFFIKILKRKCIFLEPGYSKCSPVIFPWEIVGYSCIQILNVCFIKISR